MMTSQASKRTRIKQALRKQSVFVFYLAALATTIVLTYPESDHKNKDSQLAPDPQIELQQVNFEFSDLKSRNEGQIFSI
ncbi:hypothetical protein [Vibrio nigripulchritudo]|nr:hypothetical protein [Vibrio nigripulchritudo]